MQETKYTDRCDAINSGQTSVQLINSSRIVTISQKEEMENKQAMCDYRQNQIRKEPDSNNVS